MPPKPDHCENCRYAVEAEAPPQAYATGPLLQCRRDAPTPLLVPTQGGAIAGVSQGAGITSVWPIVPPSGWCGEFKRATTTAGTIAVTFRKNPFSTLV